MPGLFSRSRRKPRTVRTAPRYQRPALEVLEGRLCPSAPPVLTLSATMGMGKTVVLSGTVADSNPASVTITFSGAASGTTTANPSGNYSFTTQASSLGTVYAVGVDGNNLSSNQASANLTCAIPSVTLSITYGIQRTVTLSGQVTAGSPGGLTVQFTGVVNGSVVTNPDGTYSLTAQASALGNIQAQTTDVWGQASSTAQATVSSAAPRITNFGAVQGAGNTWTFQGQVTDESAAGLVVQFGGLPSLLGQTATVQANGWFYLTIQLQPGENGGASAQTTDWWGLASNEAEDLI